MGILQKFKNRSNKTSKTSDLPGGLHKNIKLVDFREEGETRGNIKRYLFMKFKQFDTETGESVGEFNTSFMELDVTSTYVDFRVELLLRQTQNLAEAMFGESWKKEYDPLKGLLKNEEEAEHSKVQERLKQKSFIKELENRVKEGTGKFINKFLEENNKDSKFIIKITYSDKGYTGLPSGEFIQNQKDKKLKLSLSDKEKSLIKKYKK